MRRFLQILLPLSVLAVCVLIAVKIISTKPEPKKKKDVGDFLTVVEVKKAKQVNFPMTVTTQGLVRALTEGTLVPEISGKIVKTSENFFAGKFFEKGDVLLEIDRRDFEIALVKAEADHLKQQQIYQQEVIRTRNFHSAVTVAVTKVQQAKLTLQEEKARSDQALEDWKKLKLDSKPSDLLLRKPQMEAAAASLKSAEAELEVQKRELTLTDALLKAAEGSVAAAAATVRQRKLDLERCSIKAPYRGRIISKAVSLGEYVNPGKVLARIYSIEAVEIRLPVSAVQESFLDLKVDVPGIKNVEKTAVELSHQSGQHIHKWQGKIERVEALLEEKSRQNYLIAQVSEPFAKKKALKPGLFVQAEVQGRTLQDVFVFPVTALRENKYLWLVDENSKLQKRQVQTVWRDEKIVLVRGTLNDGEQVCTTVLSYAIDGLTVRIKGTPADKKGGATHIGKKDKRTAAKVEAEAK